MWKSVVSVVCHSWHWLSISTEDAKWLPGAVPRQGWIRAAGSGIPMSVIAEGRLCMGTWEILEVETLSDLLYEQSFDCPVLQTSAVHFHLDQRAQPQFQACKHSETSAAESLIFPLSIFLSGHIKTNFSMLSATPLTTGVLTILWPHVSWFQRKIDDFINREKMNKCLESHLSS